MHSSSPHYDGLVLLVVGSSTLDMWAEGDNSRMNKEAGLVPLLKGQQPHGEKLTNR